LSSGLTEEQANQLNNPNQSKAKTNNKELNENEKSSIQATTENMKKDGGKTLLKNLNSIQKHRKTKVQVVTKSSKIEEEEELLRYSRWKVVYPFYNSVRNWLETFYNYFHTMETGIFRYSFKNLQDFRNKMAILWSEYPWRDPKKPEESVWLNIYHYLTDNLLLEKGYFYMNYKEIMEEMSFEFNTLFTNLKQFLEVKNQIILFSRCLFYVSFLFILCFSLSFFSLIAKKERRR
jgi:hypothetical protein